MSLIDRILNRPAEPPPPYRNPSVLRRIEREHGVDGETAERWLDEALKFLDACERSTRPLAPPEAVDHAWHAFILHTYDYAVYCRDRFRRFIHHRPMEGADPAAYARAYYAVEDRFGPPDPSVWPPPRVGRLEARGDVRSGRRRGDAAAGGYGGCGGAAACGSGGGGSCGGGGGCGGGGCGGGG
jgi:uncharacterized membrane protein YgcG